MIADDMVDRGKVQSKLTKEEQEDSGTDSTDINPMKVLYRAFKMAYDMMSQKRETLRTNVKKAKDVETEYMTMKRTADQLVQVLKSYQADVSEKFLFLSTMQSSHCQPWKLISHFFLLVPTPTPSHQHSNMILQPREKTKVPWQ